MSAPTHEGATEVPSDPLLGALGDFEGGATFTDVSLEEGDADCVTVYRYSPSPRQRESRAKAMEALTTLSIYLPAPPDAAIASLRKETDDYPRIEANWAVGNWSCYDAHKRLVFCVEGTVYFRRYNDDWNPCVVKAKTPTHLAGYVSWTSDIGDEALIALAESVRGGAASQT